MRKSGYNRQVKRRCAAPDLLGKSQNSIDAACSETHATKATTMTDKGSTSSPSYQHTEMMPAGKRRKPPLACSNACGPHRIRSRGSTSSISIPLSSSPGWKSIRTTRTSVMLLGNPHGAGQQVGTFRRRPRAGSFRRWLRTVTVHRLCSFLRCERVRPLATGDTGFLAKLKNARRSP